MTSHKLSVPDDHDEYWDEVDEDGNNGGNGDGGDDHRMIDHKLSLPDDDIDDYYEVVADNGNESFDTARQLSFEMKCPMILFLFTNHRKNRSREWITPYWQPRTKITRMSLSGPIFQKPCQPSFCSLWVHQWKQSHQVFEGQNDNPFSHCRLLFSFSPDDSFSHHDERDNDD